MIFRISGQAPRIKDARTNRFVRMAVDGEILKEGEILQVSEGGGFDSREIPNYFSLPGTVCRIIDVGCAKWYSVTDVIVPD